MSRRALRARAGFTLVEVTASVVIVAILTAAVVPVIVKQIDDAEPTRAANDLNSISKGIEMFHLNVRPTYPSDLYQLTTAITTSSGASGFPAGTSTEEFVEKYANAWKGPYLTFNVSGPGITLKTAFNGDIDSALFLIDSDHASGTTVTTSSTAGSIRPASSSFTDTGFEADFMAVRLTNVTSDEADKIDLVIDGVTNSATGRFRYAASGTEIFVYYLATPISN